MPIVAQLFQQLVEEHHLATTHDQSLERFFAVIRSNFSAVKEEWVIGCFLELHCDIEQADVVVAVGTLDKTMVVLSII